jgi:hypothetical protein
MHPLTLYAFEITRDRQRDIDIDRLLVEAYAAETNRPSRLRRPMAIGLAAISRGFAVAVRRLDDCVADDLGEQLSPAKS